MDLSPLDHPAWHALTSVHRTLGRVYGDAARYPATVSPLSAVREPSDKAFTDLRELVPPGEIIAFFREIEIDIPSTWKVVAREWIDQMVCPEPPPAIEVPLAKLAPADVPAMLELTALTKPGPFLPETIRMGQYFGIRDGEKLAAMAGQRLGLDSFVEISAVCTDPAYRGRGYAQALVTFLARQAHEEGRVPFLHMKSGNPAGRTYERCGFHLRRLIQVSVITPAD